MRLRTDEQLVALFRDGNNEAFRVIYDRYRQRLFTYTRQMLPGSRQDAEDALQDVFVRAYGGLRANDHELALRAWLYRIAHNRCIDELRRPAPPLPELLELVAHPLRDPIAEAEQRESLRRLIADVRRLPDQQRSALLMRELGGMPYAEIAGTLSVSVPAVKSLLVRARVGLAQAVEARDTSCASIREDLIVAHDRGVRPTGMSRRHIRDCPGCQEFRGQLRGTSRQFAAMLPAIGPAGIAAKLLGFGGGAGGVAASGSAAVGGTAASVGALSVGAGHVATIFAAAVFTAGGAVEIQHTIVPTGRHAPHRVVRAAPLRRTAPAPAPSRSSGTVAAARVTTTVAGNAAPPAPPKLPVGVAAAAPSRTAPAHTAATLARDSLGDVTGMQPAGDSPRNNAGAGGGTAGSAVRSGSTGSTTGSDPGAGQVPSGDTSPSQTGGSGETTGSGESSGTSTGSTTQPGANSGSGPSGLPAPTSS